MTIKPDLTGTLIPIVAAPALGVIGSWLVIRSRGANATTTSHSRQPSATLPIIR
ncbi:hypothetical protein [Thermogemmatispora tikiterensis]|uniref:hypothetical protein n=1 Tax=Thermogemmatispora tikiterensis TaxID=1825093 RepID=UPI001671B016|nr:hypothetical protein [Thermogemmatispora tikiterensis]